MAGKASERTSKQPIFNAGWGSNLRIWSNEFLSHLEIRKPEPLSVWAEAHRYVADGSSPEPGKFRCSRTPYVREILDAITSPETREIICCFGIQLGKSETILNALAYYIQHEPSSILMVEPSRDLVVDFGRDRIDGMVYASAELRKVFGVERAKSKTKATLSKGMKRFNGGFLKLASAQSTTDLISRPCRIVLLDEIDQYEIRHDGNAVDTAIGRASNFVDRKVIMVSSPGTLQTSEIWRRQEGASKYRYMIPCTACGKACEWTWELVRWSNDDPQSCGIFCPECGEQVRGPGAVSDLLLARGSWECVEAGDRHRKFFHLSSLYSPWVKLSDIVEEYIGAMSTQDYDRMRSWHQNRLALPWDEFSDYGIQRKRERDMPADRFEDRKLQNHEAIVAITMGVDVQRDRVELYWWGWAADRECWFLRYECVWGNPAADNTWAVVRDWMAKEYTLNDNRVMHIAAACVDSGDGVTTQAVYKFCKALEKLRVVAVKGRGGKAVPAISAPSRSNSYRVPLYILGVDAIKRSVIAKLKIEQHGPGYIHLTKFCKGEIWAQLKSEVWETAIVNGQAVERWRKTRERNEALDCLVYAWAAFEIFCAPHLRIKRD